QRDAVSRVARSLPPSAGKKTARLRPARPGTAGRWRKADISWRGRFHRRIVRETLIPGRQLGPRPTPIQRAMAKINIAQGAADGDFPDGRGFGEIHPLECVEPGDDGR